MPNFYSRFLDNLNGLDYFNLTQRAKYYGAQNGITIRYQICSRSNHAYIRVSCHQKGFANNQNEDDEEIIMDDFTTENQMNIS